MKKLLKVLVFLFLIFTVTLTTHSKAQEPKSEFSEILLQHIEYAGKPTDDFDATDFLYAIDSPLAEIKFIDDAGLERNAGEIIMQVADDTSINPRVLLVLLEVQSSSVTAPTTQTLQRTVGLSEEEFYGFYKQIEQSAKMLQQLLNANHYGVDSSLTAKIKRTSSTDDFSVGMKSVAQLLALLSNGDASDLIANEKLQRFLNTYVGWFGNPLQIPSFVRVAQLPDEVVFPYSGDAVYYSGGPHYFAEGTFPCDTSKFVSDASGIDFAEGGAKFEVLSIADGVYLGKGETSLGAGKWVKVKYGDIVVGYWHLDKYSDNIKGIEVGTPIPKGFPIGRAGDTGGQTNIHLHLELKNGSQAEDAINPYAGTSVGWDGQVINDWKVGMHQVRNSNPLKGYNYQGSLVKGGSDHKDITLDYCGKPQGSVLVSTGFTDTIERNFLDGIRVDDNTVFAWDHSGHNTGGVPLPSGNVRQTQFIPPDAPQLITPYNEAEVVEGENVTFSWNTKAGEQYILKISTRSNMDSPITSFGPTETSNWIWKSLSPGIYYWQITAISSGRQAQSEKRVLHVKPNFGLPNAWTAEYFSGIDGSFPAQNLLETRYEASIGVNLDAGWPGGSVPPTNFSVRWTRMANFGIIGGWWYVFRTANDDGMRVYLDGNLITDDWDYHSVKHNIVTHWVSAGEHEIQVEYFQSENEAEAWFSYTAWPATPVFASDKYIPPPPPPPDSDPQPNAPPSTTDSAAFIADITLPDDTVVSPNEALVKTWRLQNTGSTTWGNGYQLVFVGGQQMGAPTSIDVPATTPGSAVDLSVNLTAPVTPGSYQGIWQLRNHNGTYFGPKIWVKITADGTPPGEPPPPVDEPGDVELVNVSYPSVVSPGETFRPEVTVRVNAGSLQESRGDLLRNIDGNLYGAWPHVAVAGNVSVGQTYTFQFYANNPITAPGSPGTYTSKWRVWADGRYIGPEINIEFRVFQGNRPPPAPPLISPADYAAEHADPSFCAGTPTDPDGDSITGYQFEIVDGPTQWQGVWMNPPYNCSDRPSLTFGDYTWHARVRDSQGNVSDWSAVRHFTKLSGLNITRFEFVPTSPSNQEHIKIYTDGDVPTGETIIQFNTATDGSASGEWLGIRHYAGALDLGTNHESDWYTIDAASNGTHRVRLTINANGGTDVREETYTLLNRRPAAPYGLWPAPKNGVAAWADSRTVTFRWKTGLPRTDSYRLVVSDSPNPISDPSPLIDKTFNQETTAYTHTFDTDYENLYWYIAATNSLGTTGGGDNIPFGIDLDPPTSVVNTLPTVSIDNKVSLSWGGSDARSGLRWYDIQVRDGKRGEWYDWLINTTDTTALFTGLAGHTYYFRSRAMDVLGHWEDYPAEDGDTFTLIDPTAAPPTAWWNGAYHIKRNLVILNSETKPTPAGYTVHLHFDDSTTPTAQEIYNASSAAIKGDDIRLVYQNATELDRFIQNFATDGIDIWFATQSSIGGISSDENNYQLYYDNSDAVNPPSDVGVIFSPRSDANTVGLWHFQEGSGTTVHDFSGHNNHGTFANAGWSDGRFGNAGLFNGSNSEVDINNQADFNLSAMTLDGWILLEQHINYPHIFNKDTYWLRLTGSGKLHFKAFGGEASGTCPDLELNKWYHVAATFNGSDDYRLYVNGQQCNQKTESHTPYHVDVPFKLGGANNWSGSNFPGKMQHLRVSNIVRTDFPFSHKDTDPTVEAGSAIAPPTTGSPDLVMQSLSTYPLDGRDFANGVIVQAIVKNEGDAATTNGFLTDFYADHQPGEADDLVGSVDFLVNDPIPAGTTITLTTVLTDLSSVGRLGRHHRLNAMAEVSATLYSQTDSTGVISETNNSNNIYSSGVEVCIAGPDVYEGDDSVTSTSTTLALDTPQQHNFHALEDEDWLKIEVSGNTTYTIRTLDLGTRTDTYLYLYDTDGATLLAANDDYSGTLASQIEWTALVPGTYYIAVKHWNPNVGGCGTAYTISFSEKSIHGGIQSIYLPLIIKGGG